MEQISHKKFVAFFVVTLFLTLACFAFNFATIASAEDAAVDSVAGCNAIVVDPSMTLEQQQAVCNAAEQSPKSSCAAANKGLCSAPKLNDVNAEGHNCICVEVNTTTTDTAPADNSSSTT